MYSFPSNDNLMNIFLADFQMKQPFYEKEMEERAARTKTISCDHTFRVSKYIGARRGYDNKFVKQFDNLFILMNEKHEIVGWRLTRTTAFEEIRSLLEELKELKLTSNSGAIEFIIVDDCCRVRALYQSVFPGIEVKLDLFHAVQRVTKTLPKGTEFSKKLSKEFGMIFRENGDCGDSRKLPTPTPGVIENNLNDFISRWNAFLNPAEMKRTLSEIEHLLDHIRKGCLSGLQPGEGTEANENIHHTLNKSLLCGATTIGPEIAIAIISLLFYGINCKIGGRRHGKNARIIPFIPLFKN